MSQSPPSPSPAEARGARRASRPGLGPKLLAACLSLALFFVAAEVVLHLAGYGQVEIYDADPKLFWRLKPNQDCFTKVDHKPVHINSMGTRGPEFQVPKPPGVVRILSVGDSKTFGWGLTEAETYSGRLQALLQEKAPAGRKVEVINAGVNAWSYPQIKVFLREFGLAWKPDYVLIADANLWTQFSEDSDPAFVGKMLSRVRLKNLLRRSAVYHFVIEVQLNHVYQKYRTRFIPIDPKQDQLFKEAQKSDPTAFFRKAIEESCSLVTSAGARPLVLFVPILGEWETGPSKEVQAAKRELCARLQVPFIDFSEDIKPPSADQLYLEADPVHLNARGNEIVAQRLAGVLGPMVFPGTP